MRATAALGSLLTEALVAAVVVLAVPGVAAADPPVPTPNEPGVLLYSTISPGTKAYSVAATPDGNVLFADPIGNTYGIFDRSILQGYPQSPGGGSQCKQPSDVAMAATGSTAWIVCANGVLAWTSVQGASVGTLHDVANIGSTSVPSRDGPRLVLDEAHNSVWLSRTNDSSHLYRFGIGPGTLTKIDVSKATKPWFDAGTYVQGVDVNGFVWFVVESGEQFYVVSTYDPVTGTAQNLKDPDTGDYWQGALGLTGSGRMVLASDELASDWSSFTWRLTTIDPVSGAATAQWAGTNDYGTASSSDLGANANLATGPDGALYVNADFQAGAPNTYSATPAVLRLDPVNGITEYPYSLVGSDSSPSYGGHLAAATADGLMIIDQGAAGRLGLMSIPTSSTAPCVSGNQVPSGAPVQCTAMMPASANVVAATWRDVQGAIVSTDPHWQPGSANVAQYFTGTLTYAVPDVMSLQQRSTAISVGGPGVAALSPLTGPDQGGTRVTITGLGFAPGMQVYLSPDPADNLIALDIQVVSDTEITAVMPAKSPDVSTSTYLWVGTPAPPGTPQAPLARTPQRFTYAGSSWATVTCASPAVVNAGPRPLTVTVAGSGFGPDTVVGLSAFGGTASTWTDSATLQLALPANPPVSTSRLEFNVAVSDDTSQWCPGWNGLVTVLGPVQATTVTPPSGPITGGNTVTLAGAGFNETTAVTIGGRSAPWDSRVDYGDGSSMTVIVPPGATDDPVDVVVANPGYNSVTLPRAYTYGASGISSVSPTTSDSLGGGTLTLTGVNLETVDRIILRSPGQADLVTTPTQSTDDSVTAVIPAAPYAGNATIIADFGDDSVAWPGTFTYTGEPAPTVASVTPNYGRPGQPQVVELIGTGISPDATVTIGSSDVSLERYFDSTHVELLVIPDGPVGMTDVVVTNPIGGSGTLVGGFDIEGTPTLAALSPSSGPTTIPTQVTVTGTGFTSSMAVTLGSQPVDSLNILSSTQLTFLTPIGTTVPPGWADLVVENYYDPTSTKVTMTNAFDYVDPAPGDLALTGMTPESGPVEGGTAITLVGSGFTSRCSASVHDIYNRQPSQVTNVGRMTFTMPPGQGGAVTVWVTCDQGTTLAVSNPLTYTYLADPVLESVSPVAGPQAGGNTVTLIGSGFGADLQAWFDDEPATVVNVDSGGASADVIVPAGSLGPVTVRVANPGQSASALADGYTYLPGPTVTSVEPDQGDTGGGTPVTIRGTLFAPGATVVIKSTTVAAPATQVNVVDTGTITATMPAFVPGPADVTVTNPDGSQATLARAFDYLSAPTPTPEVTAVSPNVGAAAGGTSVTITGTGFADAACAVTFDDTPAVASVIASTRMTAVSPAASGGVVDITVTCPGGSSTLDNGFTYESDPVISSVAPGSGDARGGTAVTITGNGFAAAATVFFGDVEADSVSVGSATSLTAVTPRGIPGPVDVVVTNPGIGSATAADAFTYTGSPIPPPPPTSDPWITAVSPNVGSVDGGETITITGGDFLPGASVTVEGRAATHVQTVASTMIIATVPSGPPGAADIIVTNPDGASASAENAFTYLADATVSSVTTAWGPVIGGTRVGITGTGFAADATVHFGHAEAVEVEVVNGSLLYATTPSGRAGPVSVTVTNPEVNRVVLPKAFAYQMLKQYPAKAMHLPKRLSAGKWNTLLSHLPITTNAGRRIAIQTACVPAKACQFRTVQRKLQVRYAGASAPQSLTLHFAARADLPHGFGPFQRGRIYHHGHLLKEWTS